jgi:hypothetical protein
MDLSRCCRNWLVHPNLAFHPATERKSIFSNGKWYYKPSWSSREQTLSAKRAALEKLSSDHALSGNSPRSVTEIPGCADSATH